MTIILNNRRPKNIRKDFQREQAMIHHEEKVAIKRSELKLEIKALRASKQEDRATELHKEMVRL